MLILTETIIIFFLMLFIAFWNQTLHMCIYIYIYTVCSSESWLGSFLAGTAPSFSIKRCANPVLNWALFINNTLAKLCCFPGKTNCIHWSHNAEFFGKLNKVIFPLQPKTHFFGDIPLPNEARWWARSCSCSAVHFPKALLANNGRSVITNIVQWFSVSRNKRTFTNSIANLRGWNYSSRPVVRSIVSC